MGRRRTGGVWGPERHGNRWRLTVRDRSGETHRQSFASRAEAERVKAIAIAEADRAARSVGEALDAYQTHLREVRQLKPRTITTTMGRLRPLLDEADALDALSPRRVRDLYAAYATGRAVDTHRNALSEARTFGRWLVQQGWIGRNPFEPVKGEGRRKAGKEQLGRDEARRLLETCIEDGGTAGVTVLLALLLGLRAGEICGLRVRDVDDGATRVQVEKGKTDNARRRLVVPEMLQPLLRALVNGRAGDEQLLPLRRYDVPAMHVAAMCEAAGVRRVTAHGLRGTHYTLAREEGETAEAVARALGHGGTRVGQRHYADAEKVASAEQRRALGVLRGGKR